MSQQSHVPGKQTQMRSYFIYLFFFNMHPCNVKLWNKSQTQCFLGGGGKKIAQIKRYYKNDDFILDFFSAKWMRVTSSLYVKSQEMYGFIHGLDFLYLFLTLTRLVRLYIHLQQYYNNINAERYYFV